MKNATAAMEVSMHRYVSREISTGARILCRKSWTAYASSLAIPALLLLASIPLCQRDAKSGLVLALAAGTYLIFKYAELRSIFLYTDKQGIWEYRGILPWAKGVRGLRWEDLHEAVYQTTLTGWLFNSHDLTIEHRFKQEGGLFLTSMNDGEKAVATINARLGKRG